MLRKLFHFVFCCLSQEQPESIYNEAERGNRRAIYLAQQNLVREKTGYRCSTCGKFYPYITLEYQSTQTDPGACPKVTGSLRKGKKAANIFRDGFYYAKSKKTLLKFESDDQGNFRETDSLPVMTGVGYAILSHDDKYIATETLGGTIEILDVGAKRSIARKLKAHTHGHMVFARDHKLFYFYKDQIRLWDFFENSDRTLWSVPKKWKACADPKRPIHVFCKSVFFNPIGDAVFFELSAGEYTYVISVKNMDVKQVAQLPGGITVGQLIFEKNLNLYTFPATNRVIIYDSNFREVETILPPCVVKNHDGGGIFPVTRHEAKIPGRTILSPDGKWLLLNYSGTVILMRHEDLSVRACLYSYTGKTINQMGFVDPNSFWYTMGDSTYIQEIEKLNFPNK